MIPIPSSLLHLIYNDYTMAKTKIKFRASTVGMREGTLYYQVIHNRVARQIATGYKLFPAEWDAERMEIAFPPAVREGRLDYLLSLQEALRGDTGRLESAVRRLERKGSPYTADDVVKEYLAHKDEYGFISFARSLAGQMAKMGRKRISETYSTAANSLGRFREGQDIPLEETDSDLMMAYESYLKSNGVCPNSISFYMRNLRSIYNRAVARGLTEQRSPFVHVYTGIDRTVKRAVPIEVIRRIKEMDLSLQPFLDYARDIFMFSFYTRGMSFVDIAFLKKKDLQNGILTYRRHKTDRQLFIKWERPMQEIVDKYDTTGSPYLLPVIRSNGKDERTQYMNEAHRVNRNLKIIGRKLGLPMPLTTYVARHGWASIAKCKNIPVATISEAMGHDSETTTRIYLASLDTSAVDKANSMILKSL